MVKIDSMKDMLPLPRPKTESQEADGSGFAQEMDKATCGEKTSKPAEDNNVQNAEKAENDKPTQAKDTAEESSAIASNVAVSIPVVSMPEAKELQPPPMIGENISEMSGMTEQTQEKAPVQPETSDLLPKVTAMDKEADVFAKQVMHEANVVLQKGDGQKEAAPDSEKQAASAKNVLGETATKESLPTVHEATDAMLDDSQDTDGNEAGKQTVTKQPMMSAPVGEDGKIDFQLTGAQLEQMEPVQPKEVMLTRVVEQVKSTVSKEKTEFFLQLKPEHLGGLSILLSAEEKGIVAKLMTSNQDVQQVLQSDMNQLQAALREKGINVVHLEVIYDQTASATAHENHDGQQQQRNTFGHVQGRAVENIEDAVTFYDSISYYDVLAEQGGSVEFSA